MKRSGSSIPQFVQRIPADVREIMRGKTLKIPLGSEIISVKITDKTSAIRFSLRTRDLSEAKVRQAEAAAYLETTFKAFRNNAPISLTHRQVTALAGVLYRAWADKADREQTIAMVQTPDGWVRDHSRDENHEEAIFTATLNHLNSIRAEDEEESLELPLGALVDRVLLDHGIQQVDVFTRPMLLRAFWLALRDAVEARQRNAAGDYSPDPKASRFPEWQSPIVETKNDAKILDEVSLQELVEGWWAESKAAGMKPSTYESYRNTMKKFCDFIGFDSASRVTPEQVVAFKDFRLSTPHPRTGKPASARTVKDADLAGLKSVFNWAVRNRKLQSNPAEGITIKLAKTNASRSRGFTEEEVKTILQACSGLELTNKKTQTNAAKRWVPWLLAYTGARIGEVAQLRKEDVRQTGECWTILITPEAGTVKSNQAREVPLHPHLVELGFPKFAQGAPSGHLFLRPSKNGDVLGPLKGVKNRVREFVRQYVTDPNVQPNHAWRHLFITSGREYGLDLELRRMITGHSGEGVDEVTYGDAAGLYREICKLPRFRV